jgi:hypothetical protein
MTWKSGIGKIIIGVTFFTLGFIFGSYYGGFITGLASASITSFIAGLGVGDILGMVGMLKEWYTSNREDKKEKRRAWKQRVLTVYNAYIDNLPSIKQHIVEVNLSGCISDYGWSDIPHRQEAEAFLRSKSFYENWRKCIQRWNDYITSLSKTRERRRDIDNEFGKKIIAELSTSGIPSRKREEGSKINENYANYRHLAYQIETNWKDGDEWVYTVNELRQNREADNPDDKVLENLVTIINNVKSGHLKLEHEEAVRAFEKDLVIQEGRKSKEYDRLQKGMDDFLAKLKQLRDDIDAERVSNGAK